MIWRFVGALNTTWLVAGLIGAQRDVFVEEPDLLADHRDDVLRLFALVAFSLGSLLLRETRCRQLPVQR